MLRSLRRVGLVGALVYLSSGAMSAQQTSSATEVKKFEVIAVDGNELVVRLPEGTRQITVPPGFVFTVDGRPLSVGDLRPGMAGTATITTRTTVTPVTVTEVRNGTVVLVSGTAVYVRTADGVRLFTQSELDKRGVKLFVDGRPRTVVDLHQGDVLSATIVTTGAPRVVTEREVQATLAKVAAAPAVPSAAPPASAPVAAAAPPPPPSPAPSPSTRSTAQSVAPSSSAAARQPVATTARSLPSTAGTLPTIGLLGLTSLAIATALAALRRRPR